MDATVSLGFDSTKLDGCGAEENIDLWYEMFQWAVAKRGTTAGGFGTLMIENCHNGAGAHNIPIRYPNGDVLCNFHTYRSSTDIRPVYGSILANLLSIPALASQNLSFPGCW